MISAILSLVLAVSPTVIYALPDSAACLKGHGNCAMYPKAAALPGGRLVVAFEKSTVAVISMSLLITTPHRVPTEGGAGNPLT